MMFKPLKSYASLADLNLHNKKIILVDVLFYLNFEIIPKTKM
jgi:hypothetical protein